MTPLDPDEIVAAAKRLTPPQRRFLLSIEPGEWLTWWRWNRRFYGNRPANCYRLIARLRKKGLIHTVLVSISADEYPREEIYTLSPLGQAVQDLIQGD